MQRLSKLLMVSVLTIFLTISMSVPAFGYAAGNEHRLAGADRYATADLNSHGGWTQSDYAILVSGENYPDALLQSSLAQQYDAPILLSQQKYLPEVTKEALRDLKVENAILVGGTGVLADQIYVQLSNMGMKTSRLAGQNRYETSIAVAKQLSDISEVVIATGEDFADALSMASIAAYKRMPIILVPRNNINSATQAFIKNSKINKTYVVGNSDIISDNVVQQFSNFERITGATKYDRNVNIINRFKSDIDGDKVFIATGNDFADALAGAAYAAKTNSPIVLVSSNLSTATKKYLRSNASKKEICILGGEGAVSGSIFNNSSSSRGYRIALSQEPSINPLEKLGSNEAKLNLVFASK
jgi:putative cell wall-binding protein